MERLWSDWQGGDAVAVQRAAHSLTGSAGNIGAVDLLGVCRQLDDLGRADALSNAAPVTTALARIQSESKSLIS